MARVATVGDQVFHPRIRRHGVVESLAGQCALVAFTGADSYWCLLSALVVNPYQVAPGTSTPVPDMAQPAEDISARVVDERTALVVDDHEDAAQSFAALLASHGFKAEWVSRGADVLNAARRLNPDLFFMDIFMPSLSGIEVCRQLRSSHDFGEALIIATSGLYTPKTLASVKEVGFDAYFLKPVDTDVLVGMLRITEGSRQRGRFIVGPRVAEHW